MRKLILIVSCLLVFGYTVLENKTTQKGYYIGHAIVDGDTISFGNRTRFDLAKDDVDNYLDASLAENGFITSPYWEVYRPNTTQVVQKEIIYRDTIEQVQTIIGGAFHNPKHIKYRYVYHKFSDDVYEVDKYVYGDQPSRYVLDTLASRSEALETRRYFFTKMWKFSYREADSLSQLDSAEFSGWDYTPGTQDTLIYKKDTFYNVRRHTVNFSKKYFQVRALDTTYNTVDTLNIRWNPEYQ